METREYSIIVERLSEEDGGGFLATVPDLPGCMSDGATQAEAVENVQDAILEWQQQALAMGRPIPIPSYLPAGIRNHRR